MDLPADTQRYQSPVIVSQVSSNQSKMSSQQYQDAECDMCGAPADTLYAGWSPMCFQCEEHAIEEAEERDRRRQLEIEEEIGDSWCQDCGADKATTLFCHLDGRRFYLCGLCFHAADHEDDYLMFCECKVPMCELGGSHCARCHYKIHSWDDGYEQSYPPEDDYEEGDFSDLDEDADEEEWNRPILAL